MSVCLGGGKMVDFFVFFSPLLLESCSCYSHWESYCLKAARSDSLEGWGYGRHPDWGDLREELCLSIGLSDRSSSVGPPPFSFFPFRLQLQRKICFWVAVVSEGWAEYWQVENEYKSEMPVDCAGVKLAPRATQPLQRCSLCIWIRLPRVNPQLCNQRQEVHLLKSSTYLR